MVLPPSNPSLEEIQQAILEIPCDIRRLLQGFVKAGKTFAELKRFYSEGTDVFSIVVTINSVDSREQTREQCIEVGFSKENILSSNDIRVKNQQFGDLGGKVLVVNLHENHDTKVCGAIAEAHRQGKRVNYTADEYDLNAAIVELNTPFVRHAIEQRWVSALKSTDTFTCISATNAVAYYSGIEFTERKVITPWSSKYKGMRDIEINTFDDITARNLEKGIIGDGIINTIKEENSRHKKALIKVTNYANYNKDNIKTHSNIVDTLKRVGINAVMVNSKSKPTKKQYDEATVIVVGQIANRTKEFRDIYSQYLDFSADLHDAAIIQMLRLLGARPWAPKLYISKARLQKLQAAIEEEFKLMDPKAWEDENREKPQVINKHSKPLPDKIAGVQRSSTRDNPPKPEEVLEIEEYNTVLKRMYPLIDSIIETSKGTRKYDNRTPEYLVHNLINTFTGNARVQPNRKLVIPVKVEEFFEIPVGKAKAIEMGVEWNEELPKWAQYYIDTETGKIQIALFEKEKIEEQKQQVEYKVKVIKLCQDK